jgi:hypothetical protein
MSPDTGDYASFNAEIRAFSTRNESVCLDYLDWLC